MFNRDHVDSIQIDVPEQLTIVGGAGFYEQTGCLKDMVTTHLLQVLGFVAMDPPVSLEPEPLRDRTGDVFRSLQPIDPANVIYGQYDGYLTSRGSRRIRRLRRSSPRASRSTRGGGPACRSSCAPGRPWRCRVRPDLVFKEPPMRLFRRAAEVRDARNALRFDLHDPPGITLEFLGKQPGPHLTVEESELDLGVRAADRDKLLAPYERLFHDALIGDQTLFTRADGVERVWEVAAPLLVHAPAPQPYAQGSWGPAEAERLTGTRGSGLSAASRSSP